MLNKEQIIKRINQIWEETRKNKNLGLDKLIYNVIAISELYNILQRKELISTIPTPETPLKTNIDKSINNIKKVIKKEVSDLKKFKE